MNMKYYVFKLSNNRIQEKQCPEKRVISTHFTFKMGRYWVSWRI